MGAVTELPVPSTGAVTDLPVPDTGAVGPSTAQRENEAFHATAGEFRKGLRAGVTSIGAAAEALAGTAGAALGLTDFAADRMLEAQNFVDTADAVGPRVRDYRRVKGLQDATDFVSGLAGQAAGSTLPALAGGAAGARYGLRGAAAGAFGGSFVPEAGEQALTIKDEAASPGAKLANAAGKGAINAALDTASLAVPASAVRGALRGGATAMGKTAAKTVGVESGTEALQEKVGQKFHSALNPARDTSEDTPAVINAAIGGAVGGAALGGSAAIASKAGAALASSRKTLAPSGEAVTLPSDRSQTPDEARGAIGSRERPADLDAIPPDSVPDDQVPEWLDQHEASVKAGLASRQKEDPTRWGKYDLEDPSAVEDMVAEVRKDHSEKVDKPFLGRAMDSLKKVVDSLRPPEPKGEKSSLQRTALDAALYDNMLSHLPEHFAEALTPKQKLELGDQLKHYALHVAGRTEEQPGPGAPETTGPKDMREALGQPPVTREGPRDKTKVVPHALMDIFGDRLEPLLSSTQKVLMAGGLRQGKPVDFKKAIGVATKTRGKLTAGLEDVVRSNLRDEVLADPKTRDYVVKEMTSDLQDRVQHGVEDWGAFNRKLDYAFGKNADAVLEAFDRQRDDVTRGYEDFGDVQEPRTDESVADKLRRNEHFRVTEEDSGSGAAPITEPEPNPTGEQATRAEEAHPYRDKRLGVPVAEADMQHTIKALRDEYDPKVVKFRAEPVLDKDGNLTGKQTIHAEDAEAPVGFSKEELERVQEKHGKAGLENSVITVVRKDPSNPDRNKTVAVSIPNLVAETARTFRWTGRRGPSYVHALVMEGLSRLMSDPDMVRFAESSKKHGWNFPDDMFVTTVKGVDYKWGDVKGKGLSSRELSIQRITSDFAQAARHSDSLEHINERLLPQMERNLKRLEDAGDKNALRRMETAIEEVHDEVHRREKFGDSPVYDANREQGTIADPATSAQLEDRAHSRIRENDPAGVRHFDSDTGEAIGAEPLKTKPKKIAAESGPDKPLAEPERVSKAPKPKEVGAVLSIAQERDFREWLAKNPGKTADDWIRSTKPKLSEMRIGRERVTPEQEAEVREYVAKVLGPQAKVLFREMEKAGSFAKLSGAETLVVSIRALDPMGVGRHEAAHALFARLREDGQSKAANTLAAAAGSPSIMAQLRKLLAGHPEAIKQLSDAEERLAYMYEFWSAGQLEMGPKASGIFGRIKTFLRASARLLLGVGDDVTSLGKAERLLADFHEGRLADRSAAAQAISQAFPQSHQLEWVAKLGDFADRVTSTADGYVRDLRVPAMTAIADKFYAPGEGQGAPSGFVQTRHVVRNQFMNRYELATRGLDAPAEARVLAELQGAKGAATSTAERSAVRAVRGLLDDIFEYMEKSGVKVVAWDERAKEYAENDLRRVEGFFPRAYDREAISENWKGFVELLRRHGVMEPEAVAQQLVSPTKAAPSESDFMAGLTYYAPNTMERKLKIPDAELAPFMKKDLSSIMYDYVNYTTRRGEYAKRFGNQGQEIAAAVQQAEAEGATPEQLRSFNKYVQAMEGSLGNHIDPKLRKFFGGVMTYQNMRLLPLALFSSLIDPLGIAVRGGKASDAFKAFSRGVRDLVSTNDDEARQFARTVGSINEATDEHMVAEMYGANYGANWQKWLNDKLFKLNGMESWNNSMRTAAASAARSFITRHAQEPGKHSERYLSELGLDKGDVTFTDGAIDLTPAVVDAVNKWVDGAVLRPHAGIRPIWMSDPHFMLVGHLKQFTYSFQKTITGRVANEALNGNYTPLLVLSSYVPFIIAADLLRALATPGGGDDDRLRKWGLSDWLLHGVNRAGISGPGQYVLDSATDLKRGKLGIESVGGPTVQQISDIMHAAAGNGSLAREGLRALPAYPALFPGG